MLSDDVAINSCVSKQYIRKLTKAAVVAGISFINCKGEQFTFCKVAGIGGRGWVYAYDQVIKTANKPKRKVNPNLAINPNHVPTFVDFNRPTCEEKKAIVAFYNTTDHPLSHIAKVLIIEYKLDVKPTSVITKIDRWVKAFKEKGIAGLEDKRGGKNFKADLDLVRTAIYGAGSRHYKSQFSFYCHAYAAKHNVAFDYGKPAADISESAFMRSVKHLVKTDNLIKEWLNLGKETFNQQPSFGNVFIYPCQQWEVDATPADIMVRIPLDKNGIKDFSSRDVDAEFEVVDLSNKNKTSTQSRVSLVRVIDNFSKASVHMVVESSNSYANARLLYKAFKVLGKAEIIRSDQGSDYISDHLQGVILELAIESIILPPARGDKKGTIERSFRTLQHSAEFESLPGFIGHNVNQRQHLENEASTKRDKKSNVATNIKGDFMWHWQLENWIENYLKHVDADKYALHDDCAISAQYQEVVFRTLGKKFNRTVSSQGITHNKIKYLDNELWAKHLTIGEKIQIRENIDDSTVLFVFRGDEFLGEAKAENIFMQSQSVEQTKATQKAYKQRVSKESRTVMNNAQKQYQGYQNGMMAEYLDIEATQVSIRKEVKNDRADDTDNSAEDLMEFVKKYG